MNLGELGFGGKCHRAALGWWDCIFRRPRIFEVAVEAANRHPRGRVYWPLALHLLPYFLASIVAGRLLVLELLQLPLRANASGWTRFYAGSLLVGCAFYAATFLGLKVSKLLGRWRHLSLAVLLLPLALVKLLEKVSWSDDQKMLVGSVAGGLIGGLVIGIAFGLTLGSAAGIAFGVGIGLGVGIVSEIAFSPPFGIVVGTFFGAVFGVTFGIAVGTTDELSGSMSFGMSGSLAAGLTGMLLGGLACGAVAYVTAGLPFGLACGISFSAAFAVFYFRLFYVPWQLFEVFVRRGGNRSFASHPLFADHCLFVPLPFADRLMLAFHDHTPELAEQEIERLIDTAFSSDRAAALRAQAVVVVRRAGRLDDLTRLEEALEALPSGKKGFLAETVTARELAQEVALVARQLEDAKRAHLRVPYAERLVDKIELFRLQVAGFKRPLSTELRRAAESWKELAKRKLAEAQSLAPGGGFQPVFRAAEALDGDLDAFLPRRGLLADLEEQIHLASASSGLVLIGRRRTGKSTLLHNLGPLVRSSAEVVEVSMQSSQASTSIASLQGLLHERLEAALGKGELPAPGSDLRSLEAVLAGANQILEQRQRKLVLGIDEYESIDVKITEGAFPEDLLALLRESMRVHRRIFWLFVGSRSSEELKGAGWTSYFVSTRLLEMPLFDLEETRELLTEPMRSSSTFKDPEKRPRFSGSFWGQGGIETLHQETGGWPHLVQLVASVAVQLVNQEGLGGLTPELFERACTKAVNEGTVVFTELLEKESRLDGEWSYLHQFRRHEEQDPPADPEIGRSLRRRWLVAETPEGRYRLRVPLMRRWLIERA